MLQAVRSTRHFHKKVWQCLHDLDRSFDPEELAYLSLTAKSEQHLRDRLAFSLQRKLEGYLVCREWHRQDITIIPKGLDVPKAAIEVKVFYTFDCLTPGRRKNMKRRLQRDVKKLRERKWPGAERMVLLFLIHPQASIPEGPDEAFAYSREVNASYRNRSYGGPSEVLDKARQELDSFWKTKDAKPVMDGTFSPGSYQEVGVSIAYWLAWV